MWAEESWCDLKSLDWGWERVLWGSGVLEQEWLCKRGEAMELGLGSGLGSGLRGRQSRMIVLLESGDPRGDGVHSLRVLERPGVLSGVVPDRNEDGGILGPCSRGNAGRTHLLWGFRIICWSTGGGRAGQLGCEGIWDPGGKSRKPEPYRRDSLGEGWSMGRKEILQGKQPVVGALGVLPQGEVGGAGSGFRDKELGKEETFVESSYQDGGAHVESWARKSVWGEA